jgi:ABC-type uncharacterized transport system permease subunit
MTITSLLSIVAILAYLGAGLLVLRQLARRVTATERRLGGIGMLAVIGLLAHAAVLYQNFIATAGLNFGVFNALSLLAWLIVLLLSLSMFNLNVENLGIAVFPLAALALVLEASFTTRHIVDSDNLDLKLHILISILASSIVTIAAIQAVLLAVQDRHLHNKHPGGFIRALPPLQTMETLLFQMLIVGFILQSLSLLTGFAFLEDMFAQHLVHKTVLSIMAWIVFAVLLWGRWKFGWRGKMAIRSTLSGFVLLMLAYIGSKLVLEVMIGRQ